MRKIWNTMLKGLVAILPIGLTLYVVYWLAVTAERLFSGVIKLLIPEPAAYWPGLGLLTGLVVLYLVGLAVNAYVVQQCAADVATGCSHASRWSRPSTSPSATSCGSFRRRARAAT